MRIKKETPTLMILKEAQLLVRIIALIMILGSLNIVYEMGKIPDNLNDLLGVAIFFFLGIFVYLNSKTSMLRIDKTQSTVEFIQKSFITKNTNTYTFSEIQKVRMKRIVPIQDQNQVLTNQLVFVLTNGDEHPMAPNPYRASFFAFFNAFKAQPREYHLGQQVANFIGVPFEDDNSFLEEAKKEMENQSMGMDIKIERK